jgi:hypothetical protein
LIFGGFTYLSPSATTTTGKTTFAITTLGHGGVKLM